MKNILSHYPEYVANIGMEVHVQLTTATKIFCPCRNEIALAPNSNICQICTGNPGVLPILNEAVVRYALKAGFATHSAISAVSSFDRKHYFYPDLPKSYQITQNFRPICSHGFVTIRLDDGAVKKIMLERIHIEEDAGKNIHAADTHESYVDLNRAGTPLLEVVTGPVLENSDEVRRYLKELRSIVQYLDISTGNMEEGAFRADANVSVRLKDNQQLGIKCELKNINSFKFIADAVDYEIERQIKNLQAGKPIRQETRLWNQEEKKSITMRLKEELADYRYIPDPDLALIEISEDLLHQVKQEMPELPSEKFERYTTEHGLSAYEAEILVSDLALAHYYEKAAALNQSKQLVNWILRDLMGHIKEHKTTVTDSLVTPERLASLVSLIETGAINNHAAKEVFDAIAKTGADPEQIVKERGLEQIGNIDELRAIVGNIIEQNPKQVATYKAGNERIFGFFVGQAMKATQGKGDPKILNDLLKEALNK